LLGNITEIYLDFLKVIQIEYLDIMKGTTGMIDKQPINNVVWRKRDELTANDYNPNHVAPPEFALLKTSILKSGWTQPIVINSNFEIVDGFHRWTVGGDKEIMEKSNGMVPTVMINEITPEEQRMATIRHNRARGKHSVVKMADIVNELSEKFEMLDEEISSLLGMDSEEVERLKVYGNIKRRAGKEFNQGWKPAPKE